MLGKILTISKTSAIVEINKETTAIKDLINLHVVFEDADKKILGEIDSIEKDTIKISFLGELTDNDFIGGLIKKPSLEANVRIINDEELKILTGPDTKCLRLGVSPLYNDAPLNVSLDELFSNHTAIFGNTGSGKTYGICRIIQNVFASSDIIPYKDLPNESCKRTGSCPVTQLLTGNNKSLGGSMFLSFFLPLSVGLCLVCMDCFS